MPVVVKPCFANDVFATAARCCNGMTSPHRVSSDLRTRLCLPSLTTSLWCKLFSVRGVVATRDRSATLASPGCEGISGVLSLHRLSSSLRELQLRSNQPKTG